MSQKFNIYLNKMDTRQLWDYYNALMNKWVGLPAKHSSRRNVRLFADIVMDEYFSRIEKLIDVAEET
jgi:hypothetical protein